MRKLWCVILIIWLSACGTATPTPAATSPEQFAEERERMVDEQIIPREVSDPIVLRAMRRVPRHEFVPPEYLDQAHKDHPLPIGYGQTISQPYIVAYMSENLKLQPGDRVLEIGTGSGYQAAILADMGMDVYSIEIVPELAAEAEARLERLGYEAQVRAGDGYFGWPDAAPFDAIIVTAAPDHVPLPLLQQLKVGGRLVIPIGPVGAIQTLWQFTLEEGDHLKALNLGDVRFVPFTRSAANP
ncbi:MAG: protein-L-isoaspartate(D-aspartate) O-methyltransferase [Chloroflexi bacterium]|nr:protein-L-isoaspartate(D-aspartate) O-methyltransferase [Chloroflexota bacterium]